MHALRSTSSDPLAPNQSERQEKQDKYRRENTFLLMQGHFYHNYVSQPWGISINNVKEDAGLCKHFFKKVNLLCHRNGTNALRSSNDSCRILFLLNSVFWFYLFVKIYPCDAQNYAVSPYRFSRFPVWIIFFSFLTDYLTSGSQETAY